MEADLFCVQVWELSSGELLLSVLFDVEVMSVTFDPSEYFMFCGGRDGNIFQVSLCSQVSEPVPVALQNRYQIIQLRTGRTFLSFGLVLIQTFYYRTSGPDRVRLNLCSPVGSVVVRNSGPKVRSVSYCSFCLQILTREKSFQTDSEGNQVFKGHR